MEIIDKNIFLFQFDSRDDRERISRNGPWFFDKSLLVLEAPKINQRSFDMEFKQVDFWLRIINLPIGLKNEKVAKKIGNNLGEYLEMDINKNDTYWGNNIRIRVKLDISKPLRRGFMLRTEEADKACWITITYERIPEFCFQCGIIGHVAKECKEKGSREEENKANFEFGMWMKCQGFNRPGKSAEIPRNEEEEAGNKDQHDKNETEYNGRSGEGLNVDLNQERLIEDEVEGTRSCEKEALGISILMK